MRLFELLLCVIAIITGIYSLFNINKKNNKNYRMIILTIPILVAHILFEGVRWQMGGIYIYIVYLLYRFLFIRKKRLSIGEFGEKKVFGVFFLSLSIISLGLIMFFQVNKLPEPTGSYSVGTISFDLVDKERLELYGDKIGEERKFKAQMWYPSDDVTEGERAPWIEDGVKVSRMIPKDIGLPGFLIDYSSLIKSNSYKGVPISEKEEKYPIVIISHGWTGYRNIHTDIGELLASHGYIAISIDHTYGSLATVFDNGEVIEVDYGALPNRNETEDFLDYANALVTTYAYDSRFVLDYLEELDDSELIDGRLDLDRIGTLGHSTGGGGVVKIAIEDDRIKAIFGFDPWVEPIEDELLKIGLDVPSLFIRSEQWEEGYNNGYLTTLINHSVIKPMTYQMNGVNHLDFTMLYMYRPILQAFGFAGELDSQVSSKIQLEYVLKFFETYLKDNETNLNDIEKIYDSVIPVNY